MFFAAQATQISSKIKSIYKSPYPKSVESLVTRDEHKLPLLYSRIWLFNTLGTRRFCTKQGFSYYLSILPTQPTTPFEVKANSTQTRAQHQANSIQLASTILSVSKLVRLNSGCVGFLGFRSVVEKHLLQSMIHVCQSSFGSNGVRLKRWSHQVGTATSTASIWWTKGGENKVRAAHTTPSKHQGDRVVVNAGEYDARSGYIVAVADVVHRASGTGQDYSRLRLHALATIRTIAVGDRVLAVGGHAQGVSGRVASISELGTVTVSPTDGMESLEVETAHLQRQFRVGDIVEVNHRFRNVSKGT
ncbi:hypothetical protein C8R47DRAFT_1077030, partial [Mycena vitilis]